MIKRMAHLLIDGYNLLYAIEEKLIADLEERRMDLIDRLHDYQVKKNIPITVVFDSKIGGLGGNRDKMGHLLIIYTDRETSADLWIQNACRDKNGYYVIVSNDNEIIDVAEATGSLVLTCREFETRLNTALKVEENPYFEDKDDSGPLYPKISTKKKGSSKKLPKRERRKHHQLKNF